MFWQNDIDPDEGPYKVLIKRDVFVDAKRGGRKVPFKLYYPHNPALLNLPVIIWSHGLGGSADGAAFLARFVSSYGYVVINIQHHGTDSSIWEGQKGHPWDIIRKTHIPRSVTLERFRDVPFLLDKLPDWAAAHDDIGQHLDLSNMGMSGHSFGALTTQVMAGQRFPNEKEELERMFEPRFKGGILYSPTPISYLTDADDETLYGAIERPLFHMTGTDDASPVEGFDYKERMRVFEASEKTERHLLILQDGDHMVYNGSRGKLEENPKRHVHEDIIKITALAYWDWLLKDNRNAYGWLCDGGFENWLGADGEYRHKMPAS